MAKKKIGLKELIEDALIDENDHPYEIPLNWIWIKIGSVIDFVGGGTPSKSNPSYWNGNVKWASVKDIKGEYLYDTIDRITVDGLENSSSKRCNSDDLIMITRMSPGKTIIAKDEVAINQDLKIVRSKLENKYMHYYFKTIEDSVVSKSSGSTVKGIRVDVLKEMKLPLASMNEQKQIVNRIEYFFDKIDKAQDLIEEARGGFEKRKEAILAKAFSGELTDKWRNEHPEIKNVGCQLSDIELIPMTNRKKLPDTWEAVKLKNIADVNPKKIKPDIEDGVEVSFVPMAAVSDVTGKIEKLETRPHGKVKKGYTSFRDGDVLFAKITPCMENGKSAVAKGLLNGFGYGSTEFYVIRPKMDSLREYLYHLHRSLIYRKTAKGYMSGAVGQQRVPKSYIEEYIIALPPIEEQQEIIRLLNLFTEEEYKIEELVEMRGQIAMLKKSILGKAFRGELGTNDPSEESSLELLKEIISQKYL